MSRSGGNMKNVSMEVGRNPHPIHSFQNNRSYYGQHNAKNCFLRYHANRAKRCAVVVLTVRTGVRYPFPHLSPPSAKLFGIGHCQSSDASCWLTPTIAVLPNLLENSPVASSGLLSPNQTGF